MKVRSLRWRSYRKKGGPPGIGNRCPEYYRGCICCDGWMFYYTHGRFGSYEEIREAYPNPTIDEPEVCGPWKNFVGNS